jgi:hypothetical protein
MARRTMSIALSASSSLAAWTKAERAAGTNWRADIDDLGQADRGIDRIVGMGAAAKRHHGDAHLARSCPTWPDRSASQGFMTGA